LDDAKSQFLKPDPQSQNIFLDLKMEALQIVLLGEVNIISYCALRAPIAGKSRVTALLWALLARRSLLTSVALAQKVGAGRTLSLFLLSMT